MAQLPQSHGSMSKNNKNPFCKSAKGYRAAIARFFRLCALVSHFGDGYGIVTPADMILPMSRLCEGAKKRVKPIFRQRYYSADSEVNHGHENEAG